MGFKVLTKLNKLFVKKNLVQQDELRVKSFFPIGWHTPPECTLSQPEKSTFHDDNVGMLATSREIAFLQRIGLQDFEEIVPCRIPLLVQRFSTRGLQRDVVYLG